MANPQHIVIIGGGAGGLELATRLGDTLGRRKQARIADLFGTIDYDPKYDHKKQRRRP